MLETFISNFLVTGSLFAPLFCILAAMAEWERFWQRLGLRLSLQNTAMVFLGVNASLVVLGIAVMNLELWKITSWLELYLWAAAAYSMMLEHRMGIRLAQVFAGAFLMVFVAADLWELPVFIYGWLGVPGFTAWSGQWFDQIHRFYVLAVFVSFALLYHWKPRREAVAFLVMAVVFPFILLAAPQAPGWAEAPRICTLFLFGVSMYLGIDDSSSGFYKEKQQKIEPGGN